MASDRAKKQLSQLTERQREVLKLRCEGLDYEAIGERLEITERTVKKHMGNIYTVFGFRDEDDRLDPRQKAERLKMLYEVYCPALREGGLEPPPPEPEVREPVPLAIQRMVEEDEYPLAVRERAAIVPIPKEKPPEEERRPLLRRLRGFIVGIVVGMALMGLLGAFYLMLSRSDDNGEPISEISTTESELPTPEIVVQTQEVTREVERLITQAPEPTQPTLTPIVITQEVLVPITVTPIPVTPTATEETETDEPIETVSEPGIPSGEWAARIYHTDDASLVIVNGHIAAGTLYPGTTDWVVINGLFLSDAPNYVSFVSLNGQGNGAWGFSLRRNDTVLWGNEGQAGRCTLCYVQTVEIMPDGTVDEVNLRDFSKENLSGTWTARTIADDSGIILINGVPTSGSYSGKNLDWLEISGLLYRAQDNVVTAVVWNANGDYSWDFAVRQGERVIWGTQNSGSGQIGEVFFTEVVIDGEGNVIP